MTSIKKFTDEMIKILQEKLPEYTSTWKTVDLKTLQNKMKEQIEKGNIFNVILRDSYITKEKTRRRLLHIANYCFFLYNRIEDE